MVVMSSSDGVGGMDGEGNWLKAAEASGRAVSNEAGLLDTVHPPVCVGQDATAAAAVAAIGRVAAIAEVLQGAPV